VLSVVPVSIFSLSCAASVRWFVQRRDLLQRLCLCEPSLLPVWYTNGAGAPVIILKVISQQTILGTVLLEDLVTRSADQNNFCFVWNAEVHHHVYKNLTPVLVQMQINPMHISKSYLLNVVVEWLTLLLRIRELTGSIPGPSDWLHSFRVCGFSQTLQANAGTVP
jgi:hypothetical protein